MNTSNLSDTQLYQLSKNKKLDQQIRNAADAELEKRKLTTSEIKKLSGMSDEEKENSRESLPLFYKLLLILFPFVSIVHLIIASKYPALGKLRKWKEFWIFLLLGYLVWTIVIILVVKIFSTDKG